MRVRFSVSRAPRKTSGSEPSASEKMKSIGPVILVSSASSVTARTTSPAAASDTFAGSVSVTFPLLFA